MDGVTTPEQGTQPQDETYFTNSLQGFVEAVRGNPRIIETERDTYNYVIGALNEVFVFDPDRKTVMVRFNGRDIRPEITHLAEAAKKFKTEDLPKLTNLVDNSFPLGGWIELRSKHPSSAEGEQGLGRIYINPKIEGVFPYCMDVFKILADYFNQHPELCHSLKVYDFDKRSNLALGGGETGLKDLNRADKIVLYFNMSVKDQVVQYLAEFYEWNRGDAPQIFDPRIPCFTQPLECQFGRDTRGLSFAEEPKPSAGGISRSELVAKVLRGAALEVGIENLDEEKIKPVLQQRFVSVGINPHSPAYNT